MTGGDRALVSRGAADRRRARRSRVAVAENAPGRAVPPVQGTGDELAVHAVAVGAVPEVRRGETGEEVAVMGCPVHCPPGRSALRGPLLALAAVAAAAGALSVAWAVIGVLAAVSAAEVLAAAVLVTALARVLRYGGLRKPAHKRVVNPVTARAALPAPRKAIGAAQPRVVPGIVVSDYQESR